MRHVLYLLLVANLVYFGWNLFQIRTASELVRELPPLPATAKRLVTLQELQQQQEQQRRVQQESGVQGKQDVDHEGDHVVAADAAVPQEIEGQEKQEVDQDADHVSAAGEAVQQESEGQGEQAVDDVAVAEAVMQAEPPGAGVSMLCQSLGPFLVVEQLEEVAARLGELGLESTRRSTETRLQNGWWVYLPAMPRPEAMEIVQLLDDNNDREYYVGKDNFIALGTFNELSRAERRMQSAGRLGLKPLLEARYKTQITHWLDLRVAGALDGDLAWITEDYLELQLEPQACK